MTEFALAAITIGAVVLACMTLVTLFAPAMIVFGRWIERNAELLTGERIR